LLSALGILAGRFAHAAWLRGDKALHAMLGIDRFPTDDTICICFAGSRWVMCSVCLSG
jgi:hypothetical protein